MNKARALRANRGPISRSSESGAPCISDAGSATEEARARLRTHCWRPGTAGERRRREDPPAVDAGPPRSGHVRRTGPRCQSLTRVERLRWPGPGIDIQGDDPGHVPGIVQPLRPCNSGTTELWVRLVIPNLKLRRLKILTRSPNAILLKGYFISLRIQGKQEASCVV